MIIRDPKGFDWFVNSVNTQDDKIDPILDLGRGDKRVVRTFVIQTDPSQELKKEDVLSFHHKGLTDHIYKSGLELDRELTISPGQTKGEYVIFAVCKFFNMKTINSLDSMKPQLAQDLLKKKK